MFYQPNPAATHRKETLTDTDFKALLDTWQSVLTLVLSVQGAELADGVW
jgi:hypothetical protein